MVERFVLERHIQSLHRQIEESEPNEIAIGQRVYYRGKLLGKGGFAKCYEFVCSETKKTYAGKVVEKETLQKMRRRQKMQAEIQLHKLLTSGEGHPNIV